MYIEHAQLLIDLMESVAVSQPGYLPFLVRKMEHINMS